MGPELLYRVDVVEQSLAGESHEQLLVPLVWFIQVPQMQHLQGIHTCREEALYAGLQGPRVQEGVSVVGTVAS